MYDFGKLGAFYPGKRVDLETATLTDELVLYASRDLTTHAVIIGGRKRLSAATASRVGSVIRNASGARKQASDVEQARQTEAKVLADIEQPVRAAVAAGVPTRIPTIAY
jgi:hypothetical protein